MSVLDRKLIREVRKRIGQVLSIALIMGSGVAMLVMTLGTLDSLEASRDDYYRQNSFADVFASATRAPETLKDRIAAIPGVALFETRIVRAVTLDVPDLAEPASGRLVSLPPGREPLLNQVTLVSGRFPMVGRANEAVVNDAFAEANGLAPGDQIGALINGLQRRIAIVGVGLSPEFTYALPPGGIMPDNRRFGIVWMNRDALAAAFDLGGAFNDLSISLARGASATTVIGRLDTLLDPFGGTGAHERKDQQSHAFLSSEIDQLRNMANILPVVFMSVAAYLLNTILSRMIDTDREQIGALKAFGFTNRSVAIHYLKLALIVAAIGLAFGYALGLYLEGMMSETYMRFYSFPSFSSRPSVTALVAGAVVAIAAAVVGALGGVRRAMRLAPAAAISPEPPPVYGTGLLARLDGGDFFDGPTRMMIRHLARWPARSGSTVLGVATATGLLIATFFAVDGTNFIMNFTFERTGRYDASVTLGTPQSIEVMAEIERLPGVVAAEPGRDLRARFSHGPIEEEAVVIGIDQSASLRQIVDVGLKPFQVPGDGVVLSSQLASMIEAGPGDRVTIEMLDGNRAVEEVYVSAITEEYMGAQAYVDRRFANDLLKEGELVQSAYLALDPLERGAFYEAAKERPALGAITFQKIALEMFRETVAESQSIMMRVFQVLSAAIAAGVVYTSARITLSERARELASMRVLGFRRLEVSYILMGQLLLLVLLALPLGCLLGYGISALIAQGMQTELYRVPVVIEPASYGTAMGIVFLASIVTALFVRREVDRLDLIGVLKTRD